MQAELDLVPLQVMVLVVVFAVHCRIFRVEYLLEFLDPFAGAANPCKSYVNGDDDERIQALVLRGWYSIDNPGVIVAMGSAVRVLLLHHVQTRPALDSR